MIELNKSLTAKHAEIATKEQRWEAYLADDAETVLVAFGTAARVAMEAVEEARAEGLPVDLIRPITLWPFPHRAIENLPAAKFILTVKMNDGQMVEDMRLAVNGRIPVHVYGFGGGWVPDAESVRQAIDDLYAELCL